MESFHNAFASLRCFDATKNKDNKKPYFNFFDRDNNHIASARHSPPYNAKVFFLLWLKAAPYFGEFGKEIVEANTPAEIEALRNRTIRNVHCKDGEFITGSEPFISAELRAIVDNILFMSVYGHKTLFETRVSGPRRAGFQKVALEVAQKNEDEFFEAWKQYRALNPAVRQDAVEDVDSETERIRKALQGSDDDEDGPGPAGPPAAAAAAPAPAAAAAAVVDSEGN
jgi:hypothetical protein